MRNILKIISIISVCIVISGAGFAAYAWYQYNQHESDVLIKVTDQLNDLQNDPKYESLGYFDSCPKNEGGTFAISALEPFRTNIVTNCIFENADVRVEIDLEKRDTWEITKLNVYPLLY